MRHAHNLHGCTKQFIAGHRRADRTGHRIAFFVSGVLLKHKRHVNKLVGSLRVPSLLVSFVGAQILGTRLRGTLILEPPTN